MKLNYDQLLSNFAFNFKLRRHSEEEVAGKRRLTLAGIVCVSARTGEGMTQAIGAMFSNRKGRDVYVLGAANVGKSSFIRAALKSMRKEGNYQAPGKRSGLEDIARHVIQRGSQTPLSTRPLSPWRPQWPRPSRYSPPRHPTRSEPSFLECNGYLGRGE